MAASTEEPRGAGMCAAPRPIFRARAEPCLDRIVHDICAEPHALFIVPNPVIVRLTLPEGFSQSRELLVRFVRGVGFPTVQDVAKDVLGPRPDYSMNMIGHDHPGMKVVAFTQEKVHRAGHKSGDFRLPQPACAATRIEVGFDLLGIPEKELLLLVPGERTFGRAGLLDDNFALPFELFDNLMREGISETKGDEISRAFAFKMRKFAARMKP